MRSPGSERSPMFMEGLLGAPGAQILQGGYVPDLRPSSPTLGCKEVTWGYAGPHQDDPEENRGDQEDREPGPRGTLTSCLTRREFPFRPSKPARYPSLCHRLCGVLDQRQPRGRTEVGRRQNGGSPEADQRQPKGRQEADQMGTRGRLEPDQMKARWGPQAAQTQARARPGADQRQTRGRPEADQRQARGRPEAAKRQTRGRPEEDRRPTRARPEADQHSPGIMGLFPN
ncbi:unnamed protein product [Lota lota]